MYPGGILRVVAFVAALAVVLRTICAWGATGAVQRSRKTAVERHFIEASS
jgi:hypothetical protein